MKLGMVIKQRVTHLRVFGCLAYPLIPAQQLQKLNKAMRGVFIGYCFDAKAHRVYNLETWKVITSSDVHFE